MLDFLAFPLQVSPSLHMQTVAWDDPLEGRNIRSENSEEEVICTPHWSQGWRWEAAGSLSPSHSPAKAQQQWSGWAAFSGASPEVGRMGDMLVPQHFAVLCRSHPELLQLSQR